MKQFIKTLTGIVLITTFLTMVYATLNYAQSTEHRWQPDDFVTVDAMCQDMRPLIATAALYQLGTERSVQEADMIWLDALKRGICISSANGFYVKLLVKQKVFARFLNIPGLDGELWSATTPSPNGDIIEIFVGIMTKEYLTSKPTTKI